MNKSESKYFNTAVKMDLALISLLKKKSLEYITVREICEEAGVNRSTFYLHYEDIGDLLEETTRYLLNDFLSYFSTELKSVSLNYMECELDELIFINNKYLTPYLTYIKDNKEIFSTVLSNSKTFNFEYIHGKMFENIYIPILERFGYPIESRNYIVRFYLNGINAIVVEWLKSGCNISIEEIKNIIITCIYGLK